MAGRPIRQIRRQTPRHEQTERLVQPALLDDAIQEKILMRCCGGEVPARGSVLPGSVRLRAERLYALICLGRLSYLMRELPWMAPGKALLNGSPGTKTTEKNTAADAAWAAAENPANGLGSDRTPEAGLACLAAWHERWRARMSDPWLPGVFYTPDELVDQICRRLVELRSAPARHGAGAVFDPAVGCGAFVLGWLRAQMGQAANQPARWLAQAEQLFGTDLDGVAVALARARVIADGAARGVSRAGLVMLDRRLMNQIQSGDSLRIESKPRWFAVVLGNPPFQFLSGRGSPVARLARQDPIAARRLAAHLRALTDRYPASSQGCRDLYKWFLDRSSARVAPGGWLAMVTPNTWLYLQHFRDVRKILTERLVCREICDLGFGAFAGPDAAGGGPTLGAAIVYAQAPAKGAGISEPAAGKPAEGMAFFRREGGRVMQCAVELRGGDFEICRSAWARAQYAQRGQSVFGDLATVTEGEHDIFRAGQPSQLRATGYYVLPILNDAKMERLQPTPVEWWPDTVAEGYVPHHHTGERMLLRKTGAGLLVGAVAGPEFALAHQNVYIVKSRRVDVPVQWLGMVLTAEPLQRLYREGPHGQPGRPMAQLRIAHVKRLPFPSAEALMGVGSELEGLWRNRPANERAMAAKKGLAWRRRLAGLVERLLQARGSAVQ